MHGPRKVVIKRTISTIGWLLPSQYEETRIDGVDAMNGLIERLLLSRMKRLQRCTYAVYIKLGFDSSQLFLFL